MRVRRKARHGGAVVHAPAVLAAEVLAHLSARKRGLRPQLGVAPGVGVVVVGAKKKGIDGVPGEAQGFDAKDGVAGHGEAFSK